jgi:hypothetical protein
MARYLVVAHQTVTSPQLLRKVRALREQEEARGAVAEFVLLVPATPVRHLLFRRGGEHDAGHDAEAVARRIADRALFRYARKGLPLYDARIGAADPIQAIDDELRTNPGYTAVVISTLPEERSRWLRMALPGKVAAAHGLPVHHVVAEDFGLADLP